MDRLGIAGLSMGGVHACLTASVFPRPLAVAPLLAPHSAAPPYVHGALSHALEWRALAASAPPEYPGSKLQHSRHQHGKQQHQGHVPSPSTSRAAAAVAAAAGASSSSSAAESVAGRRLATNAFSTHRQAHPGEQEQEPGLSALLSQRQKGRGAGLLVDRLLSLLARAEREDSDSGQAPSGLGRLPLTRVSLMDTAKLAERSVAGFTRESI